MNVIELLLLAVGLAMDAFAVSICKGLSSRASYIKTGLLCGVWFGVFQALMPFLGWLLASTVAKYIEGIAPYVAFAILAFLGIKMIVEARHSRGCYCEESVEEKAKNASLSARVMFTFAIATSIDALATGITFAAMNARIGIAIAFIGVVTFLFSFVGAAIGARVGERCKTGAEIAGGIIIFLIGLKILVEHLISLFS